MKLDAVHEGTHGQTRLELWASPGALAILFVGATLPTPLYPIYSKAFGFGRVTLTLVYAVYVLGNLVALLFFGRLPDQVGRRVGVVAAIGLGKALCPTTSMRTAAVVRNNPLQRPPLTGSGHSQGQRGR